MPWDLEAVVDLLVWLVLFDPALLFLVVKFSDAGLVVHVSIKLSVDVVGECEGEGV